MELNTLMGIIRVILFFIWMLSAVGSVQNSRHPSKALSVVRFLYVGVPYEKWGFSFLPYGSFMLHGNANWTGTGNWTSTTGSNGSWFLSLPRSQCSVSKPLTNEIVYCKSIAPNIRTHFCVKFKHML